MPKHLETRLVAWLNWRGMKWSSLTCSKRASEIAAMKAYYAENPNVTVLKAKYR